MNAPSLLHRLDAPSARYVPWTVADGAADPLGWIRRDRVEWLVGAMAERWRREGDRVLLQPAAPTVGGRTAAVDETVAVLLERGELREHGERYPVGPAHGEPEMLHVDRGAAQWFGIRAFGVHCNGYVRRDDGIHYWVGRRSHHKPSFAGMLDNTVAGGMPRGFGVRETLAKEAREEASIPDRLIRGAVAVPDIAYIVEAESGLRVDHLFCFDLELPEAFRPEPGDDEVESFDLLPLAEVASLVATRQHFKFNCNWVLDAFLERHPK